MTYNVYISAASAGDKNPSGKAACAVVVSKGDNVLERSQVLPDGVSYEEATLASMRLAFSLVGKKREAVVLYTDRQLVLNAGIENKSRNAIWAEAYEIWKTALADNPELSVRHLTKWSRDSQDDVTHAMRLDRARQVAWDAAGFKDRPSVPEWHLEEKKK